MNSFVQAKSSAGQEPSLHPFDPYDKVPRDVRKTLRAYAKKIYTRKETSVLFLTLNSSILCSKPDYLGYMDRYAESLDDL